MHTIGRINREIYHCITDGIIVDEVVITEKQLLHIRMRHPGAYDKVIEYIKDIIQHPDYIIEDTSHNNTGLVIKRIAAEQTSVLLVLRIATADDFRTYKNSIITSWAISDKRLENYLRNKRILYKRE